MPKQPHDLSRSFAFTSSLGCILPFYQHMCHPHDELFFSAGAFTRLAPMLVPSLAQVDFHLDYFFVPLTVMYTPSNVLHYGTDDLISSVFTGTGADGLRDKFPVLNLNETFGTFASQIGNDDSYLTDWRGYNVIPTPVGSLTNGFYCAGQSAFRLLDMLGYNPKGVFMSSTLHDGNTDFYNPSVTPWFLAAYQAIYQLYFRNDDREKKDYVYNFDKYYNKSSFSIARDFNADTHFMNLGLLTLRYRSRYKDYFNSVKVSPLSSPVGLREFYDGVNNPVSPTTYLNGVRQFLGLDESYVSGSNLLSTELGANSTTVLYNTNETGYNISTSSLRSMFALEKLIRVIGRTNKDYESQVLAHFGVKVPHDVMHNITHVAHDMYSLRPEPVTSTASTSERALGEVGGQGQVSFSGHQHKFTAPCHGVFMAVISSIPRMRYEAGFDKALVFNERLDFWQPEFDRLGMQPLYAYEVIKTPESTASRVGWQFAYEHLKRKFDRVSMAFTEQDTNGYSAWVLTQRPYIGIRDAAADIYQDSTLGNLGYQNFLVQPRDLDKILTTSVAWGWDSASFVNYPYLIYATDPFLHDVGFNCKVVNFMSEYGEPELD